MLFHLEVGEQLCCIYDPMSFSLSTIYFYFENWALLINRLYHKIYLFATKMIMLVQGKMSRTWIQYNKPGEPNFTHAGILLALGLHGRLCALATTDVYRYLTQVQLGDVN